LVSAFHVEIQVVIFGLALHYRKFLQSRQHLSWFMTRFAGSSHFGQVIGCLGLWINT
jgi:hypothetical protein